MKKKLDSGFAECLLLVSLVLACIFVFCLFLDLMGVSFPHD